MPFRVVIEIAGPVRGKGAPRAFNTQHGPRLFTDDRTRKYEAQLRFHAQQVMQERKPISGPCSVEIEVRLPIPKSFSKRDQRAALAREIFPTIKPDCNNYSKALDAFNGVVWEDDKQIVRELVEKVYSNAPGMTVTITKLEGPRIQPVQDGLLIGLLP